MKFIIDMNLSPQWVPVFNQFGFEAKHWSDVGDITAKDIEIMQWCTANGYIVFTHDLDFSAILFATQAVSPSVIQLRRVNDIRPQVIGEMVISAISNCKSELESGAVMTIEPRRNRIRILPMQ